MIHSEENTPATDAISYHVTETKENKSTVLIYKNKHCDSVFKHQADLN